MKHLLGGQIGLEDFIFAHRKGKAVILYLEIFNLNHIRFGFLNYFVAILY